MCIQFFFCCYWWWWKWYYYYYYYYYYYHYIKIIILKIIIKIIIILIYLLLLLIIFYNYYYYYYLQLMNENWRSCYSAMHVSTPPRGELMACRTWTSCPSRSSLGTGSRLTSLPTSWTRTTASTPKSFSWSAQCLALALHPLTKKTVSVTIISIYVFALCSFFISGYNEWHDLFNEALNTFYLWIYGVR